MNPSSSSSFSSPPLYKSNSRPQSSTNRETPSIIPLDYNYQIMPPSSLRPTQTSRYQLASRSSTTRQSNPDVDVDMDEDLPYSSLFGDPVPPPPPDDFLGSTFQTSQFLRSTSVELTSEEENNLGQTMTIVHSRLPQRLFPQVPYTTLMGRRYSNTSSQQRNFEVMPTSIPRLKPPDIQILPNSSGGSSTDPQNSPNYMLLAPEDIIRKPAIYDKSDEPEDVSELKETYTVSDAQSIKEFMQTTSTTRKTARSEDTRDMDVRDIREMDVLSPSQDNLSTMPRQFSNESYSSGEWFRSGSLDYPEFNKMPKLRPSSKNVMSIKRDEMPMNSPVAAMINDSNGSSSGGEERLMEVTQILDKPTVCLDSLKAPERPPSPSPSCLRSLEETLVLTPREYIKQRRKSVYTTQLVAQEPPEEDKPPPIPPKPHLMNDVDSGGDDLLSQPPQTPMTRERSPVIIKDSITMGGDYRVDQSRHHKKTSFTIISEKSPQSSRAESPRFQRTREHTASSLIPTKSKPKNHLQRKSLSSTQMKLPHLIPPSNQMAPDDSPRPSVQFDMTGRYSPSKLPPQKGILHHKESLSSSQDTLPLAQHMMRRRSSILPPLTDNNTKPHMKSCETLPMVTDPYRTSIPRLNRSALELRLETAVFPPGALPRPLKPNPNPTRKQKGLLKVLNHQEIISKIPLKSNWSSMDDLWLEAKRKASLSPIDDKATRRRSSSTSPSRRSSTQTTSDRRSSNLSSVTTSDFSFRRPSIAAGKPITPQTQRRKSVFQFPSPGTTAAAAARRKSSSSSSILTTPGRSSRTRIAKPTTLSPILGTPNKDSSSTQSPMHSMKHPPAPPSDSISDTNSRRDSLSKIPIRSQGESRSNSRMSIHGGSRAASRTGSPTKDYNGGRSSQMATSRSGSRASQHIPSQPGSRAPSRANSRTPSRSTSRASTRPISLPGSRPTSRLEMAKDIANSRSNSRLSMHSSKRGGSISPAVGRKTPTMTDAGSRYTSKRGGSISPAVGRKTPIMTGTSRRKSISLSPPGKRRAVTRRGSISPTAVKSKRRSRSRSKTSSSPDRQAHSRIPVSHPNGGSSTKSPPTRKKPGGATDLRRTGSLKTKTKTPSKQPASAKKMPTSVHKTETSVKRTPSSVGKQGPMVKKQTNNTQKSTNIKREPSNVGKKPAAAIGASSSKTATRESTSVSSGKPGVKDSSGKVPTRESTSLSMKKKALVKTLLLADKKAAGKNKDSSTKTDASSTSKEQANNETAAVTSKNGDKPSATQATGAAGTAALAALKRQPSSMSLMRVSSKISMLKKRTDSNVSKNTLDLLVPELETGGNRASSPTKQLADMAAAEGGSIPAAILEKSQKTLENIQKTVTEATDEIHKTINENLTDLKSLEQDMGLTSDSAGSPTPSVTTVVEKKSGSKQDAGGKSVSRLGTAEGPADGSSASKSPLPPSQPIEASVSVLNPDATQAASALSNGSSQLDGGVTAAQAAERVSARAISVMPEVDCESANFQSFNGATTGNGADGKLMSGAMTETDAMNVADKPASGSTEDYETEAKRRSPDGQGGSQAGSGKGSASQEYLENKSLEDEETPKGCCRCCAKFCMPCRRSRCSRCCQRKKSSKHDAEAEQPVLSATSSATTTNLELIDEKPPKKTSCWQKLNCCKSCGKKSKDMDSREELKKEIIKEEAAAAAKTMGPPKQSSCGLCISKIFCCRSVNKIDPKTGDETEVKKCCFCIPCRKKRGAVAGGRSSAVSSVAGGSTAAWEDPERGITATDAAVLDGQDVEPRPGCCKRFCNFLLCCRKKKVQVSDSRRASIRAPPPEENRRKLHADLIEFNSKMKGAIPVLPLWIAWFCFLCNILIPGLGTLLSGLFCICVGIPRFSPYDSAKARFGSFIINVIVAISQLFCVLFCFVGWGWSIWWGTIMLKCAKKLSKIRKVEKLEEEEDARQAAIAAAAAAEAAAAGAPAAASEPEPAKS